MNIKKQPITNKPRNKIKRIRNGIKLANIVENMKIKESEIHREKKIIAAKNCIKYDLGCSFPIPRLLFDSKFIYPVL